MGRSNSYLEKAVVNFCGDLYYIIKGCNTHIQFLWKGDQECGMNNVIGKTLGLNCDLKDNGSITVILKEPFLPNYIHGYKIRRCKNAPEGYSIWHITPPNQEVIEEFVTKFRQGKFPHLIKKEV